MAQLNGNGRSDPERLKFERDILAYQPELLGFLRSLTKSQDTAEDISQDTYIKAINSRHSFQPGTNLKAWLFMIARNTFFSERRRTWRQKPWDPALAERILTSGIETSEADAKLDFDRMLLCIPCLGREQADALIAIGYLGLDYEDAAWRFGVAVGTIKSRVSRARKALVELLENADELELVDTTALRTLTQGLPKTDPYYPIAKAYEDLYAPLPLRAGQHQKVVKINDADAAWNDLVASGALDGEDIELGELFRMEEVD
jgi:RNA polymerase sigma-70 factor (ECF subfamily)